jgi:hypothetical protein
VRDKQRHFVHYLEIMDDWYCLSLLVPDKVQSGGIYPAYTTVAKENRPTFTGKNDMFSLR